jgi:hypothetical protein
MSDTIDPQPHNADRESALEGWMAPLSSEQEIRDAAEKAFDYRGDITLTLQDGRKIEGYVFDRRSEASLSQCQLRLMPSGGGPILTIPYSELAGIEFTGKDTAAGKSFETWVRKYNEKKVK